MIVLDTNVVSEAIKPEPHPLVRAWMDVHAGAALFLSSVTVAELLFGVGVLPHGRRKALLATRVDTLLHEFATRVLPFDTMAAQHYARLAVQARAAGNGFPTPDGYIAGIAAAHGFSVASRDASAFKAAGLTVINPWAETA